MAIVYVNVNLALTFTMNRFQWQYRWKIRRPTSQRRRGEQSKKGVFQRYSMYTFA